MVICMECLSTAKLCMHASGTICEIYLSVCLLPGFSMVNQKKKYRKVSSSLRCSSFFYFADVVLWSLQAILSFVRYMYMLKWTKYFYLELPYSSWIVLYVSLCNCGYLTVLCCLVVTPCIKRLCMSSCLSLVLLCEVLKLNHSNHNP